MTPGNRYAYASFIDYAFICSQWGARNSFSFHGGPCKIIEKHCFRGSYTLFYCLSAQVNNYFARMGNTYKFIIKGHCLSAPAAVPFLV